MFQLVIASVLNGTQTLIMDYVRAINGLLPAQSAYMLQTIYDVIESMEIVIENNQFVSTLLFTKQ